MQQNNTLTKTKTINKDLNYIKKNYILYLFLFPTILYFILFRVVPIFNMRLAFYDFKAKSDWVFVGMKYFKQIYSSPAFFVILSNTLIISFLKFILLFPFFVVFAILLNEIKSSKFRAYVQIVSYLPHFLSWVVIAGIWITFLSPSSGAVNQILGYFNIAPIDFLTDKTKILHILFWSEAWRSIGWDSILFFSTIISISPSLYEAAKIDGADRLVIIRCIILPALVAPMVMMFILNLGFFLNAGFDQVLNFTNDSVNSVVDILDTYIYRVGLINGKYSLATAVGLLKGVIGVGLVLMTHFVSKKAIGKGVW